MTQSARIISATKVTIASKTGGDLACVRF